MKSIIKALHEWWIGVRRIDVRAWRYGDKCNAEMRIRCGPFGVALYAVMEKHAEPWEEFWADLRNLVDQCSDGGTARVPIIRMVFAEAKRSG